MKADSLALSLLIALILPGAALAEKGGKGPGDSAYEHASDKASFKREDGKPGKGEKDKQKGLTHDGEHHEPDDQDSEGKDRKFRSTEQEQDRVREQDRLREETQTEQREADSKRVESAGTGAETTGEEKPRTGFWQRLFEQRSEKKAAGGN